MAAPRKKSLHVADGAAAWHRRQSHVLLHAHAAALRSTVPAGGPLGFGYWDAENHSTVLVTGRFLCPRRSYCRRWIAEVLALFVNTTSLSLHTAQRCSAVNQHVGPSAPAHYFMRT